MKAISIQVYKLSVLVLCLGFLVNCGGGDSDDPEPGGGGIPADFDLFEKQGTWRVSLTSHMSMDESFTFGTDTVNMVGSADAIAVLPFTFSRSGSQITTTNCDAYAPEVEDISDFDLIDDELEDDEDFDPLDCTNEVENYTKISDSQYRIEYSCGSEMSITMDFAKVSDQTEFDFGSLSFTSQQYSDLDTTDGVCGTLTELDASFAYTPQPNSFELLDGTETVDAITVAAPYNGTRIEIGFDFFGDVQPGNYTVVDFSEGAGEVEVYLSSEIYGGLATDPGYEFASGGTVSITSVSATSASGTFSITTDGGDTIVGSFSFDIG